MITMINDCTFLSSSSSSSSSSSCASLTNDDELFCQTPVELAPIQDIKKHYVIESQLGAGSFGQVYVASSPVRVLNPSYTPTSKKSRAVRKTKHAFRSLFVRKTRIQPTAPVVTVSNRQVALKVIENAKLPAYCDVVGAEVNALRTIPSHPNIVGLDGAFVDDQREYTYIALQLGTGGDLLANVSESAMDVARVKSIVCQVASALLHAAKHGYVHRDVKLENIIFTDKRKDSVIVADWGLSKKLKTLPNTQTDNVYAKYRNLEHPCGSLHYAAPELVRGEPYSLKVDCFALGVCMYALLTQKFPYFGESDQQIARMLLDARYKPTLPEQVVKKAGKDAQKIIDGLLCRDQKQRMNLVELLQHPFFTK